MLKKILIGLVVVVGGFLIFVATRPSHMHIERSVTMRAPAEIPYAQVVDFHNWAQWSPWDHLDPSMKKTYDGPASGTGAHYAWVGNKDVGEGAMTIVAAKPSEQVDIRLEFLKPFAATNATTFTFKKGDGDVTLVTWSMDGENAFMSKMFGVFMNMDKMVGGDFERGLGKLKEIAETQAIAKAKADEIAKAEAAKAAAAVPPAGNAAPTPEPGGKPGAPPPIAPTK
jgi:hypothetical protein